MSIRIFALFLLLQTVLLPKACLGNDLLGAQPVSPYGIISTFSTETPKSGEALVSVSFEKSGEPDFYRYSSLISLGIRDNIQATVSFPYVDDTEDGLEDTSFSIKHRLLDEQTYWPSLAYILAAAFHSGSDAYTSDGYAGGGIVASKRLGPVNGHLNFIYTFPGESDLEDEIRLSAGMDFFAAHNFKLLAEIYSAKTFFSENTDRLEARFGYRFHYSEKIFSTLAIGFGLNDKEPEYRLIASITLFFPQIDRDLQEADEDG